MYRPYEEVWSTHPAHPVSEEDLRTIHTKYYLHQLKDFMYVADALELPALSFLRFFDPQILEKRVLEPMRWATEGTILASQLAIENQIVLNLGGGYHHAQCDQGEGFCIYSDIAIAIAKLRSMGHIRQKDKILIIDLDAHQGNGLERVFHDDQMIYFFDMYNQEIYPQDKWAQKRINCDVRLSVGASGQEYNTKLTEKLPPFLQKVGTPKIAFYFAGTDIDTIPSFV